MRNFTAEAFPGGTSIFLYWTFPILDNLNGLLLGYTITYFRDEFNTSSFVITINTSNISSQGYLLTGLEEYVVYFISVSAYTTIGNGPSSSIRQRTLEAGNLF